MQGGAAALTPAQQFANMGFADKLGAIGQGATAEGFMGSIDAMGKGNLLMAGAPLLGMGSDSTPEIPQQESYIRPQVYDPVTQTYTSLEPVKPEDWGDQSFAGYRSSQGYQEGGEVQQRYQQPVRTVDPAVQEYNRMLMNQARQEYVQQQPMTNVPQLTPSLMAPPPAPRPAQATAQTPVGMDESRRYMFNPATQTFAENPDYKAPDDKSGLGFRDVLDRQLNPYEDDSNNQGGFAAGGAVRMAQGGITSIPKFQAGGEMESDAFVVPADVVSALGNGSTDAGVDLLNQYLGMAMPIEGEGDGLSDDVPATIDGEQPARVADGEVYIPADIVALLGEGDPERGSSKLYEMMDKIRETAHGDKQQQREVKPEKVMPV